jgi:short-subunit dehydrogenase
VEVKDNVFVVTGASSGIGLATAKLLSASGAKLGLFARNKEALQQLAIELPNSVAVTVDVTDFPALRKAIAEIYAHFGRIDGLINNAGRSYAASIEQIDPIVFDEIFHLNVLAPIIAMQEVIPVMRAQGKGCIVNINSGTAFMTIPHYSVYSASKRALVGFGLTAREELSGDGIVVSQVYPFITATNFGRNRVSADENGGPASDYSQGDTPEFVADLILQAIRVGEPEYFANDNLRRLAGK